MRVLHFVTGGFSGATKVAIDIIVAHNKIDTIQSLLVLRRKKTTVTEKLDDLADKGIEYQVITGTTHIATMLELKRVCQEWQPDILVAHGFPEHLLGRRAGLWAGVSHLIQIEHNSQERYTPWKLYQSRQLSLATDRIVAVSKGVAEVLVKQNLSAPIIAITNGIDTSRFGGSHIPELIERPKDLIMVARYAKSKDHITLIKALFDLKNKGMTPTLTLVGSGRKKYKKDVQDLIVRYGLEQQVCLIEYSNEVDKLLEQHKVFVMSSRFEGLNLAVLEAMASGCLVVGSQAVGVAELIDDTKDGFLFPIEDAIALADILYKILTDIASYQDLAIQARHKVLKSYDKNQTSQAYYDLFQAVVSS